MNMLSSSWASWWRKGAVKAASSLIRQFANTPNRCAPSPGFAEPFILLPLVSLCTVLFLAGVCAAQTQELIKPVPTNQLRAATAEQTQALDRIRQRPTTQSVDLVEVNVNALRGDATRLSVPNSTSITLSRSKVDVQSPSDFTWYGTLSGVPGQATLVVRGGNITGTTQDQGTLYRIEPVGNGVHALIRVDQGRFPPDHPPSFEQKERRGDIQVPPTAPDANRSDAPVGIDVLVAYTTAAKTVISDINATIALAVAEANQSYVNSGARLS